MILRRVTVHYKVTGIDITSRYFESHDVMTVFASWPSLQLMKFRVFVNQSIFDVFVQYEGQPLYPLALLLSLSRLRISTVSSGFLPGMLYKCHKCESQMRIIIGVDFDLDRIRRCHVPGCVSGWSRRQVLFPQYAGVLGKVQPRGVAQNHVVPIEQSNVTDTMHDRIRSSLLDQIQSRALEYGA